MLATLKNNDFLKNISVLMSGTALAQLVTLASSLLLSRLYEPSAFGHFAIYTSLVTILSVIVTWRYELAIVLPEDDEDASVLLTLAITIVIGMSLLFALFILLLGGTFSRLFELPVLLLWCMPISTLLVGLYQCLNYWGTRHKQFKSLSLSQMFRSGGVTAVQIPAGLFTKHALGLIGGQMMGQFIATLVLARQLSRKQEMKLREGWRSKRMKKLAGQYSEFPKYGMFQAFINAISQNIPPFFLIFFYGAEIAGFYAISLRLLQLPVSLVGQSIRQVFFQRASEMLKNGEALFAATRRITLTLAYMAIVPAAILVMFGPDLFAVLLGDNWYEAGQYARWVVVWLFFAFINPPSTVLMTVLGLQKKFLVYETGLMLARVSTLLIGGLYASPLEAVAAYCLIGALFNLALIVYAMSASRQGGKGYAAQEKLQEAGRI